MKKLLFTWLIVLPSAFVIGQQSYLPEDLVAGDFKKLLERPLSDFKAWSDHERTDSAFIEKGFIYTEADERMPFIIYKPLASENKRLPVVICLHGTGGSKDQPYIRELLYRFIQAGFLGIAIDARYHGERIKANTPQNEYTEAIIAAWKNQDPKTQEHPFFFDTSYDLWRLTDYLITRPDVDPSRIGMTGISMGGIQTWLAASVDKRIKVAVPIIAAQSFRWSLENEKWMGRAKTIWSAHQLAAKDLRQDEVNKANVEALWNKVIPGITDKFDCPSMIRLFAPRPLLLLNTELDENCPLPGAQIVFQQAMETYREKNASDKLKIDVQPNEPHRLTPEHATMMVEWFRKWL